MAHAASWIVALSARNSLCVAGSSPFRKHIAIVGSTNHLCSSKSCKFEQIMGRADQHPFLFDLVQPAQQELPEPACLLDLPKHRLDRLLAQPIRAVIALPGNLLGHGGEPAALLGFPSTHRLGGGLWRPGWAAASLPSPPLGPGALCPPAWSPVLASRIWASRRSLLATQSGSSSPRRSPPCWRSSAAS